MFFSTVLFVSAQKYKVVLDAGHGGKDPGSSNGKYIEKDIALKVTLEVGRILKQNPIIDVVYTRDKDVFVELHKRAELANESDASLFVSLHCDSFKPRPAAYGASTYVLGLNGNKENLEYAKKENAVILLEDDYKNNYDYDPNSPESVIGLSVLQEENLDASLAFADFVQTNFVSAKRKDRSVKQANFLVLRETVMPSVLIELGFISNAKEARFLNSVSGQKKMASAVAKAIERYISQIHTNDSSLSIQVDIVQEEEKEMKKEKKVVVSKPVPVNRPKSTFSKNKKDAAKAEYRVQLAASRVKINYPKKKFKKISSHYFQYTEGYFKYFYGKCLTLSCAKQNLKEVKNKGFKDSFIVAYLKGKKISLKQARGKQ